MRNESRDLPHHLIRVKGWAKLRRPYRACRTLTMGHAPKNMIETWLCVSKRLTASNTDIWLCHCAQSEPLFLGFVLCVCCVCVCVCCVCVVCCVLCVCVCVCV